MTTLADKPTEASVSNVLCGQEGPSDSSRWPACHHMKSFALKSRWYHIILTTFVVVTLAGFQPRGLEAVIVSGLSVVSADIGTNPKMSPSDAIDGSGLPGGIPALSGAHEARWEYNWWSATYSPQITIDLGATYSLTGVHIWNYNESGQGGRNLREVKIYVSPDASASNLVELVTNGNGAQDHNLHFLLPQSTSDNSYTGFDLDLAGVVNSSLLAGVRYFQIAAINTYGSFQGTGGTGAYGGLAEVQFDAAASAVPEKSSTALLLGAGLVALVAARYRSR